MQFNKPAVSIGLSSIFGWLASIGLTVAAFVGEHSAAEWKAALASLILIATHAGRQYQAGQQARVGK